MSAVTTHPPTSDSGTEHFVALNGLRFHYVTWGNPKSPMLICLHGLRGYARTFEPLAKRMMDRLFVLSLDQRGRGDTDWDPNLNYYTDQYVQDLEALAEHLGRDRFHLLGHSMGGANALLYAYRNPGRLASIVLEDSGPGTASADRPSVQRIFSELKSTPMFFSLWEEAAVFWRSVRPNVSDAAIASRMANSMREADGRIVWKHDQAGIAQCRINPASGRGTPDLWPCVDAIQCSGLILRGAKSDYLSRETVEAVCTRNPNVDMYEVPDAGHYVHDDNPEDFMRIVEAFLDDNLNN